MGYTPGHLATSLWTWQVGSLQDLLGYRQVTKESTAVTLDCTAVKWGCTGATLGCTVGSWASTGDWSGCTAGRLDCTAVTSGCTAVKLVNIVVM